MTRDVRVEMMESDFEKVGLPVGRHKRVPKAIANLGVAESRGKSAPPHPDHPSTDAAERRQFTVMFRDLVGSTKCRRAAIPRTCAKS